MIFTDQKSGLVRLSDAVKDGVELCANTTSGFMEMVAPYATIYARLRALSGQALAEGPESYARFDEEIKAALSPVPNEVAFGLPLLQTRLHSQVLSTILSCCFTLESYINTFAYFLLRERDFLGLIRDGHESSADLILDAIDRLGAREKWKTIGRFGGEKGFDSSRPPFQNFHYLFNFRDDHVHDKVVALSDERARKRYNDTFPDPVFGMLDLGHALFAADTYWGMVGEVHRLLGIEPRAFQRHYNLSPWHSDERRKEFEGLAKRYRAIR